MLRIHKLDKETGKPTADPEAIDRWGQPATHSQTSTAVGRASREEGREADLGPGWWGATAAEQVQLSLMLPLPTDHVPRSPYPPLNHPSTPTPTPTRFARKLKKVTAEQGARFVSYDAASGTWKFEVEHFSKYGLDSEEDSDEEELQAYGVRGRAAAAAAARHAAAQRGGEAAAEAEDEDGMEDSKLGAAWGAAAAVVPAAAAAAGGSVDGSSRAVQLSGMGGCPL